MKYACKYNIGLTIKNQKVKIISKNRNHRNSQTNKIKTNENEHGIVWLKTSR